jgi:hypothetical protein
MKRINLLTDSSHDYKKSQKKSHFIEVLRKINLVYANQKKH